MSDNTEASKGATGAANLPLASRDRAWDSSAAEGRVREWAGGDDLDWAKYRKAFFWYDAEKPKEFGSYKLGFADVIDGVLTAVPRGVFAVAGVLQGSRGGVNIPDADKEQVRSKVDSYYAKMRKEFGDNSITGQKRRSNFRYGHIKGIIKWCYCSNNAYRLADYKSYLANGA